MGHVIRPCVYKHIVRVRGVLEEKSQDELDELQGEEEEEPEVWEEVERATSVVEVTDEDSGTSIEVERIDSITMRSPGGRRVQWRLDWPDEG